MKMKNKFLSKLLLLIIMTILMAAGQAMFKLGSSALSSVLSFFNIYLILGVVLYGFALIMIIDILRTEELSRLFPMLALSYVWVLLISSIFFHETITQYRILGTILIICGVAVLSRATNTKKELVTIS